MQPKDNTINEFILEMDLENEIKERFVAFVDVLGFSEMVNRNNIKAIEKYFTEIKTTLSEMVKGGSTLEYMAISDSIIVFTPDNKLSSFLSLVNNIRMIQIILVRKGFWVRGGIALGPACYVKNENIIFGKGYIDAYNLEKEATFPRVIVSPKIISHLSTGDYNDFLYKTNGHKDDQNYFSHGFFKEYTETTIFNDANGDIEATHKYIHEYIRDGPYRITKNDSIFVSYAHYLIYYSMNREPSYENSSLKIALDSITTGLYSEQKHYLKYRWLRDYFLETLLEIQKHYIKFLSEEAYAKFFIGSYISKALKHFDSIG